MGGVFHLNTCLSTWLITSTNWASAKAQAQCAEKYSDTIFQHNVLMLVLFSVLVFVLFFKHKKSTTTFQTWAILSKLYRTVAICKFTAINLQNGYLKTPFSDTHREKVRFFDKKYQQIFSETPFKHVSI